MHSQIPGMGSSFSNSYSAGTLDKGDSGQRGADVRKKVPVIEEIEVDSDSDSDSDADWMVQPGYEAAGYGGRGRKAILSKSEPEGDEPGDAGEVFESISVWV